MSRHASPLALWLLSLSLTTLALSTASAKHAIVSCSSPEECCDVCGADSLRCARGPCSSTFVTKKLFSFSLPTTSVGFWDAVFSLYSMVPYLAFAVITLELVLRTRSWSRVFAFAFIPIASVLTSSILVKSLGHCAECARPCGSCIQSTGMPSGHTTNAVGICLWLLLEMARGFGRYWATRKRLVVALVAVLVFAPVPYSRHYLGDHTSLQIAVGSANGVVLGVVYFLVLRFVVAKRLLRASQWLARGRLPIVILDDYSLSAKSLASSEFEPTLETSHSTAYNSADSMETGLAVKDQVYAVGPLTPPVRREGQNAR